jgi:methenyltetrahydromethanopterin cyclohydrolase
MRHDEIISPRDNETTLSINMTDMPESPFQLNARAAFVANTMLRRAAQLCLRVEYGMFGSTLIDAGVSARGGIAAGLALARVAMADLADVKLVAGDPAIWPGPAVQVTTDHPIAACLASQYAGWSLSSGKYFAMGSGPMRAAAGKEKIFEDIGHRETAESVVGVLEASKLPPDEICAKIAEDCGLLADRVTLLVARTASMAGTIQVVARSVETALHKLHEIGFDLSSVQSGYGIAPLPPIAADDLTAIGWTNDAILHGGEVTLWVRGDDDAIRQFGPRVPSSASRDYGEPFSAIFKRYNGDFYKIDPLLFSPAAITFVNLNTGRTHRFGQVNPSLLRASFES